MKANAELLEIAKDRSGGKKYFAKKLALSLCKVVIIPAMVIYILFSQILGIAMVNGVSMIPTLQDKSIVMMRRIGAHKPSRGDIIVFKADSFNEGEILIKRVIALGGDTIDIDYIEGNVFINGEKLDEPYVAETMRNGYGIETPFTVPDGHVFVMGDNRNYSVDSRFLTIGCIPYEDIIGIVLFK